MLQVLPEHCPPGIGSTQKRAKPSIVASTAPPGSTSTMGTAIRRQLPRVPPVQLMLSQIPPSASESGPAALPQGLHPDLTSGTPSPSVSGPTTSETVSQCTVVLLMRQLMASLI